MKELPKMYHNNIDKNINNNKKIFSTMYNSDTEVKSTNNFINNKNNYTKFIIVANKKIFESRANKISISFEVPHESGSLYHKLSHFIYNGINMNKIESRPVQGKAWEYRFFVDIEGNLNDAAVQNALRGLTEETIRLKILGNYVSAEGNE